MIGDVPLNSAGADSVLRTTQQKALKVLVSAFAFSPTQGSEFGIGWDYVRAIAMNNKVWVIARSVEREETEQFVRTHPDALRNIEVHYVSLKNREFHFPLREVVYSMIYKRWQRKALQLAKRLDAEIDFDLIHHVTGTGFREPGYLWKLNKPFVWGPIGGLQYFPWRLLSAVPPRSRAFFVFKILAAAWAMHLDGRPRRAARKARLILAGSSNVARNVRRLWSRDSVVMCEVSSPEIELPISRRRDSTVPLEIVWCGKCEPRKALNIVLLALSKIHSEMPAIDWRLTAVGDGPSLQQWKVQADSLGVGTLCRFMGRVARNEAQAIMASAHCMVQPSIYDATSTVVVEALANGLPIVCLDHFGFSDAVQNEWGIKIPPRDLRSAVEGFSAAIIKLATDEELRYRMARAAREASRRFTVSHKARILDNLFREVLADILRNSSNNESPL